MNILLLASHGIAEYDDLRMFSDLGYDVFCPGGYAEPAVPGETLRPALPNAPDHPELRALCDEQRDRHAGQSTDFGVVDWAKADLHPKLIEWADVIIAHHFVDTWIGGQWDRLQDKRVVWRTCGQSNPRLEHEMRQYEGLQIVRYSPAEARGFRPLGTFAGQDALIRFGKYPDDYAPWIGDDAVVGNLTQNLDIRGDQCGLSFWEEATIGLPTRPGGTGSERLPNGTGELSYTQMLDYLRHIRVFLYMGTQPASYTLALIEAMMAGVPVVSRGPRGLWMPPLFEGHEIAVEWANGPKYARDLLVEYLSKPDREASEINRERAIDLFGIETIGKQWRDFLG